MRCAVCEGAALLNTEIRPASPAAGQGDSDCDYIIVGGGSAGCVAAWRLITETDARVVLLEMGAEYRSPYLKISPGYSRVVPKGIHCTLHHTVPQTNAGDRVLEIATGRVIGGGGKPKPPG